MLDLAMGPGFLDFFSAYALRRSSLILAASSSSSSESEPKRSSSSLSSSSAAGAGLGAGAAVVSAGAAACEQMHVQTFSKIMLKQFSSYSFFPVHIPFLFFDCVGGD